MDVNTHGNEGRDSREEEVWFLWGTKCNRIAEAVIKGKHKTKEVGESVVGSKGWGRSRLGWKELKTKDTQAGKEGSKSPLFLGCVFHSLCDPGLTTCSLSGPLSPKPRQMSCTSLIHNCINKEFLGFCKQPALETKFWRNCSFPGEMVQDPGKSGSHRSPDSQWVDRLRPLQQPQPRRSQSSVGRQGQAEAGRGAQRTLAEVSTGIMLQLATG